MFEFESVQNSGNIVCETPNCSRACERSSPKICPRLWKDMWNSLNSMCGSQYLEGIPQKKHCVKPHLAFYHTLML